MSNHQEILYPYLLKCCRYCTDPLWRTIFEELAYGVTPYGTYISKDFFCCNYKGKEFSYKIEKKDPCVMYQEIFNLLFIRLGMNSNQDKFKKKAKIIAFENSTLENRQQWNSIRKKNVKDFLIEKYIISMSKKYSLDDNKTKYLYSIIYVAMSFKLITSKDIEFENGEITNIRGIEFKNGNIHFSKFFKSDSLISIDTNTEPDTQILSTHWKKYIKDLKKEN